MKESEARKKWCPMVRFDYAGTGPAYDNRSQKASGQLPTCIGSDCAMWVRESDRDAREEYGHCGLIKS